MARWRIRSAAPAFVWAAWLAMLVAALHLAVEMGNNVPIWDEWDLVPYVTGDKPVTPSWLWSLHNEHRIPLPRLVYVSLVRLTGDYRSLNVFNAVVLASLAAAFVLVTRRIRGRTEWSDALFPLILLNWGHVDNLLWSFQVQFVLSTAFVCLVLLGLAGADKEWKASSLVLVGLGVLALPLCGANGLAMVPALTAWLVYAAAHRLRSERPEDRNHGRLALACASISLLLMGLYLVGYRGNPERPPCPGIGAAVVTTTEILSMSLGQASRSLWPFSSLCLLGLCAGLTLALCRRALADRRERLRSLGLLMVMAALLSLAVLTGWGRSGYGGSLGFALRYVTPTCPLLCWCYVVWVVYWPGQQHWAAQAVLVLSALFAASYNVKETLFYGGDRHTQVLEVEKDVWSGDSVEQLVKRHGKILYPRPEVIPEWLEMLRRARIGPYRLRETERKAALEAHYRKEYPMMRSPVLFARSERLPLRRKQVAGKEVVAMQEGELRFRVPRGSTEASGVFGASPDIAQTRPADAMPQSFTITMTLIDTNGNGTVLFTRYLNAYERESDRGFQPFSVPLPRESEGLLSLQVHPGPSDSHPDPLGDWAFWTDVEVR